MRTLKAITLMIAFGAIQALAQQPPQQPSAQRTPPPLPTTENPPASTAAAPPFSADALYNLANSYARAGKPGLAVLNYERAALLSPNDADISANLDYVRTTANVPTEPRSRLAQIALAVNPTPAAWLGVLGIALLGTALLTKKVTHRYRAIRAASLMLGIGLVSWAVSNALLLRPRMRDAVVLVNQTPARVSPVPMGDTAFLLREADTVTITAEHEDFILIRTQTGRTGWVARVQVGAVVP